MQVLKQKTLAVQIYWKQVILGVQMNMLFIKRHCAPVTTTYTVPSVLSAKLKYNPNSTWLVTSRLDMTRLVRRVELVVTSVSSRGVRQARHSQNAWTRHVERVVSRRDEPSGIWAYYVQTEESSTIQSAPESRVHSYHLHCRGNTMTCTHGM